MVRAAVALLGLLALGCSILRPHPTKTVTIDTSPPGAMVTINGLLVGTSPCDCVLPRRGGPQLVEVLPPRDSTERLWVQRREVVWGLLPNEGAVLYFDLRLEGVSPTQSLEIRHR
jgi:hypothetical protein